MSVSETPFPEADASAPAPAPAVNAPVSPPRAERRRAATLGDLKGKKAREGEIVINLYGEDNVAQELVIRVRAISNREYDDLQAKYPPTRKQRDQAAAQGMQVVFDIDQFAPQLISKCAIEPLISLDDATEIWNSENWAGGEAQDLFFRCQRLCQGGLDVPFNAPA